VLVRCRRRGGEVRQAYGLGKLVRKATKAVKKVLKSDIGKAALLYGAGTYLGGTKFMGGDGTLSFMDRLKNPALLKNLVYTDDKFSPFKGIAAAIPGNHVGDIGYAIETFVRSHRDLNIGILEDYVGHGIGTQMHMPPSIPNYGSAGTGPELEVGMAIAIEPMLVLGSNKVHVLEDEWTVVSSENSFASHWENTIAITENGPEILTKL